eukprot:TRINITY_DN737_c0_g1_i1.p1 TRINITY_DN737_c0_g1~~TRINITY_DN737_c0_g1_i1.p1  ORF type:complete len:223 (-),score=48.74 TRINITY_DN737_c0_g1_i1:115-783(-)
MPQAVSSSGFCGSTDENGRPIKPIPVLLIWTLLTNIAPLALCAVFLGIHWGDHAKRCHEPFAFLIIYGVIFIINIIFGIRFHLLLRHGTFKGRQGCALFRNWFIISFIIFALLSIVYDIVVQALINKSSSCIGSVPNMFEMVTAAFIIDIIFLCGLVFFGVIGAMCECCYRSARRRQDGTQMQQQPQQPQPSAPPMVANPFEQPPPLPPKNNGPVYSASAAV